MRYNGFIFYYYRKNILKKMRNNECKKMLRGMIYYAKTGKKPPVFWAKIVTDVIFKSMERSKNLCNYGQKGAEIKKAKQTRGLEATLEAPLMRVPTALLKLRQDKTRQNKTKQNKDKTILYSSPPSSGSEEEYGGQSPQNNKKRKSICATPFRVGHKWS